MKVLRIIASADPRGGGPIEGTIRVQKPLAAAGVVQEVATLDRPDASFFELGTPFRVHPLGDSAGQRNAAGLLFPSRYNYSSRMLPWLRENLASYDAAIVSGLWNYATWAARSALAAHPIPYVVFTHGMLDPWFRERYPAKHFAKQLLWKINEGPLLARADAVLFTSQEERDLARGTFRPYSARERVIAYGTTRPPPASPEDREAFRALLPALGDRPYLLFLSRIHAKKGCDLLIKAFAAVAAREPDLQLVIAGPGDAALIDALRKLAVGLGIAERIHWPGMIRDHAKWGALRGCTAFVLPSHQENFGIAVIEAAACGRPLLLSNRVNIWHEFAAADAALIAADDVAGTKDSLRQFLALDAAAQAAMGNAARALFEQSFEISAAAVDLAGTLRQIVEHKRARV